MVDHPKPWISTRSREYQPGGQLRLGQILVQPNDPRSSRITRQGTLVPDDIQVDRSWSNSHRELSKDLGGGFKAWANVVEIPLGMSANATHQSKESWVFEELHGEIMPLNDNYGKEALNDPNVKSWINSQYKVERFFRRLYMVTGIRWGKGVQLKMSNSQQTEGRAGGGVDLTPVGAPGQIKVSVGGKVLQESQESFTKSTDFVFQYALHEINYGATFKAQPYNAGETEADESDEDEVPKRSEAPEIEDLDFKGFGEWYCPEPEIADE